MTKDVIETLIKISNEKIQTKSSLIICYRNKEKESNSPNGYIMQITMLKDDIIDIQKAINQLSQIPPIDISRNCKCDLIPKAYDYQENN